MATRREDRPSRAPRVGLLKDPWSWATHFAGFLAAIAGLVGLVLAASGDTPKVAAMAIYGASLVALFGASSLYHFFDLGEAGNRWLRRLDHVAIFLLIAGSYVPMFTFMLDGAWRVVMLSIVGGVAALGILFKLVWISCPRVLSVAMYVALGWAVLIPSPIIFPALTAEGAGWFLGGGAVYTLGALVYWRKWPDPVPGVFGFHEVWHLFVLGGAAMHFVFIASFLEQRVPPF